MRGNKLTAQKVALKSFRALEIHASDLHTFPQLVKLCYSEILGFFIQV